MVDILWFLFIQLTILLTCCRSSAYEVACRMIQKLEFLSGTQQNSDNDITNFISTFDAENSYSNVKKLADNSVRDSLIILQKVDACSDAASGYQRFGPASLLR